MAILLIFIAASFTASTLVVSALMLSSRISRQEPWEEPVEVEPEVNLQPVSQTPR